MLMRLPDDGWHPHCCSDNVVHKDYKRTIKPLGWMFISIGYSSLRRAEMFERVVLSLAALAEFHMHPTTKGASRGAVLRDMPSKYEIYPACRPNARVREYHDSLLRKVHAPLAVNVLEAADPKDFITITVPIPKVQLALDG